MKEGGLKMRKIITISREFSSGGREVGKKLSEALNCAYYDKALVGKIAEESGLDARYIDSQSEQYTNTMVPYLVGNTFLSYNQPMAQLSIEVQQAQRNVLKNIAEKENAVIIGRCADYVLREYNPLKVFIYSSDMEKKVNRCYEKVPADKSKAFKEMEKEIKKIDKKRSNYYQQNTDQKWSDMSNYNLCIDTAKVGIDGAVKIIVAAINLFE